MSPRSVEKPSLRRMIVPALFVGALFLVVFLRQPNGPDASDQWVLAGPTMGTAFTVKVVDPPGSGLIRGDVEDAVRGVVDSVDFAMSTYRPDSEVSRFNRHDTGRFGVSAALIEVFVEAWRVAELSGGAFDITIGPLVDAWGFGPRPSAGPPDAAEIEVLLVESGMGMVEIDREGRALQKKSDGVRCDLSAIAKGYAVDLTVESLVALGATDFMVEIGGEVRAVGRNVEGDPWRIGVELPSGERPGVWAAVALADTAMATSGDYRNYYEHEGVRISHTIDPRTGRPITHALASVTVIHPSCMTADALATALNVLGPEDGRALVEREGLAALFLVKAEDGGFDEWASEAWRALDVNIPMAAGVEPGESE